MNHRSERGDHQVKARRWLPWVILAVAVVFLTRGFDHMGSIGMTMAGGMSLIPLIVIGAIGYFLWSWWNDDEDEAEDGKTASASRRRHRRHGRQDQAETVLRERFANGEIDEKEYLARKSVLED
jgi:uncharacterized membrane protein